VQASKDKIVLFEKNVKQESNDNDVDFDLLDEDYYNNDNSKSVVKTNNDDNDNEKSMTLRKVVPRDSNDKEDVLEE
jgi:hypothetical protein